MSEFRQRLYLSTIADDACPLARDNGLGLELAEFCTASNLDRDLPEYAPIAREKMQYANRFVFHGPFAELCPAAIDPLVREVTERRYLQAAAQAAALGIHRMVIHTGYIPMVYYPVWMIEQSVAFWKQLLPKLPDGMTILLENVMEDTAEIPVSIARDVNDPRLRLCLDIGHANTRLSKAPVADWIRAMAPWLSHLHLHNNDGDWDLHQNLGDGVLPVAELIRQAEALCPAATYTIETMHAAPSVQFLKDEGFL